MDAGLRIKIVRFLDRPIDVGDGDVTEQTTFDKVQFSGETDFLDLVMQVESEVHRFVTEAGAEQYREDFLHPFPAEELQRLQDAVRELRRST
jgi:hypothetical protein